MKPCHSNERNVVPSLLSLDVAMKKLQVGDINVFKF